MHNKGGDIKQPKNCKIPDPGFPGIQTRIPKKQACKPRSYTSPKLLPTETLTYILTGGEV